VAYYCRRLDSQKGSFNCHKVYDSSTDLKKEYDKGGWYAAHKKQKKFIYLIVFM